MNYCNMQTMREKEYQLRSIPLLLNKLDIFDFFKIAKRNPPTSLDWIKCNQNLKQTWIPKLMYWKGLREYF